MRRKIFSVVLTLLLVLGFIAPLTNAAAAGDEFQQAFGSEINSDEAKQLARQLPYIGDSANCQMSSAAARYFADTLLSGLPQSQTDAWAGRSTLYASLLDLADDGFPVLMTSYLYSNQTDSYATGYVAAASMPQFWYYADGIGTELSLMQQDGTEPITLEQCEVDGKQGLCAFYLWGQNYGAPSQYDIYTIQNGKCSLKDCIKIYEAIELEDTHTALSMEFPNISDYWESTHDNWMYGYEADIDVLQAAGWYKIGDCYYYVTVNGDAYDLHNISQADMAGDSVPSSILPALGIQQSDTIADVSFLQINQTYVGDTADTVASMLQQYADARETDTLYSFPDIASQLTENEAQDIVQILNNKLTGTLRAAYQVSDTLLYVVAYQDETPCGGALLQRIKVSDEQTFQHLTTDPELASQALLEQIAQKIQQQSNVTIQYSTEIEDSVQYLSDALDGQTPNTAAKMQISRYMEEAIADAGTIAIESEDNIVTLTADRLTQSDQKAQQIKSDLESVLGETTLNKDVPVVLRVVCDSINPKKPMLIRLDTSMKDALLSANELQLLLGNGQHGITLTTDALHTCSEQYDTFQIQLAAEDDAKYTIAFQSSDGTELERMPANIGFSLPASSETATVFATYQGYSDNWGGQFDVQNQAISFETAYSGQYEVLENAQELPDIADLNAETAEAIRFMVSKGYFSADEQGNFQPDAPLDRNAFTQALVRMFYALDRNLTTSFSDVSTDSEYYPYIASGEQHHIVEGYEDNTFRGDRSVLREEVIALCSRTLVDQRDYRYPDDPAAALYFTDRQAISDWALEETALAVQVRLIEDSGALLPQQAISRADAALLLYRLFMLLYELPQAVFDTDGNSSDLSPIPVIIAVLVVAVIIGILLRRHKQNAKHEQEDEILSETAQSEQSMPKITENMDADRSDQEGENKNE